MTIRTPRVGAALLATIALVACNNPADKPVTDTATAAHATPTVVAPTDSTAPNPAVDSGKPAADSTKPAVKK